MRVCLHRDTAFRDTADLIITIVQQILTDHPIIIYVQKFIIFTLYNSLYINKI